MTNGGLYAIYLDMEQEYTPDQIDALEYEALMNNEPMDDAEYDAMMSAIYDNYESINT